MQVVDYSEKSFVVLGETKPHKESLKNMGGKFNKYLKNGDEKSPGWIFPKKNQEEVANFVEKANSNEISADLPTETSTKSGENTLNVELPTVAKPKSSSYQFVKFKIYIPKKDQMVVLTSEDGKSRTKMEGKVIKTETHNDVVDTAYIQFEGNESPSLAVISRSKWQIFGYFKEHSLYFTD